MYAQEVRKYAMLNDLAESGGIVLMGGTDDLNIPMGELKQAFGLAAAMYNRSFENLSLDDASELYDSHVAPLSPETVLLHIGNADESTFSADPGQYMMKYKKLIQHIRAQNKKVRIGIISLDAKHGEMNSHLKSLAETEQCEFGDIAHKRVWNPKETQSVTSFLYSTGFVHPLRVRQPLYDLVKILFCCTPEAIQMTITEKCSQIQFGTVSGG